MPAAHNPADDDVPDDWLESPASEPARPIDQMEPAEAWNPDSQAHPIDDPEPVSSDVTRPVDAPEEIKSESPSGGGRLKAVVAIVALVVVLGAVGLWQFGLLKVGNNNGSGTGSNSTAGSGDKTTSNAGDPNNGDASKNGTQSGAGSSPTAGDDPSTTQTADNAPTAGTVAPPGTGRAATSKVVVKELVGVQAKPRDERIEVIRKFVEEFDTDADSAASDPARVRECIRIVDELLASPEDKVDEDERKLLHFWKRHLDYMLKLLSLNSMPRKSKESAQIAETTIVRNRSVIEQPTSGGVGHRYLILAFAMFGAVDDTSSVTNSLPVPQSFDPSKLDGDSAREFGEFQDRWKPDRPIPNLLLRKRILVRASEMARDSVQWDGCRDFYNNAIELDSTNLQKPIEIKQSKDLDLRLSRLKDELETRKKLEAIESLNNSLATATTNLQTATDRIKELESTRVTALQAVQLVARRGCSDFLKQHQLNDRWKMLEPKEGTLPPGVTLEARKKEWDRLLKQLAEIEERLKDNAGTYDEVAEDYAALGQLLELAQRWEAELVVAARVATVRIQPEEFQKLFGTELDRQLKKNGKLSLWETLQKLTWPTKEGKLVVDKDVEVIAETEVAKKLKELIDGPAVSKVLAALVQTMESGFAKQIAALTKSDTELRREIEQAKTGNQTSLDQAKTELTQKISKASDSWTSDLKKADLTWSERLELAANGLREEIKATLMKPRPLPDDQVSRMGDQVAESVKKRLFEWGYVPPEAPPTDRPYRGNVLPDPEKGSDCFQRGYGAYMRPSPASAQEAVRYFSKACQFDPEVALYRYYLGLAQHRCGDVEAGALQVRCGAELELGRPDRNLGRQLEPVQGPRRQWLERIRDSIHLAPVRLDAPLSR